MSLKLYISITSDSNGSDLVNMKKLQIIKGRKRKVKPKY